MPSCVRYGTEAEDALLRAEADFLMHHDRDYTLLTLKERATQLRAETKEGDIGTSSPIHVGSSVNTRVWRTVYNKSTMKGDPMGEGDSALSDDRRDPSGRDSLTSYLCLRYLHTAALQMRCRGVLNYFRSLERTIALDAAKTDSFASRDSSVDSDTSSRLDSDAESGVDADTSDARQSDYYSTVDDCITVTDGWGRQIVYDSAIHDYNALAAELVSLGSFHIARNAANRLKATGKSSAGLVDGAAVEMPPSRPQSASSRPQSASARRRSSRSSESSGGPSGGSDAFRQRDVDRAAVLLDLWTNESAYQAAKARLAGLLFNIYQHSTAPDARRQLAQLIADLAYTRPRHDLEAS